MKKLISVVFCIVFMLTAVSADSITAENTDYNYIIDGKVQKLPEGESGFSYKDRTYVPLRYLAELFKFNVSWDGDTETISIDTKKPVYELKDDKLYKDGKEISIEDYNAYKFIPKDEDIKPYYDKLYGSILVFTGGEEGCTVYFADLNSGVIQSFGDGMFIDGAVIDGDVPEYIYYFEGKLFSEPNNTNDKLYFFDMRTFEIYGFDNPGAVRSMFWHDGNVYYSGVHGNLYSYKLGGESELIAETDVDGVIFVSGDEILCCGYENKGVKYNIKTKKLTKELTEEEMNTVAAWQMLKYINYYDVSLSADPADFNEWRAENGKVYLKADKAVDKKKYPMSVEVISEHFVLRNIPITIELIDDYNGIINFPISDETVKSVFAETVFSHYRG